MNTGKEMNLGALLATTETSQGMNLSSILKKCLAIENLEKPEELPPDREKKDVKSKTSNPIQVNGVSYWLHWEFTQFEGDEYPFVVTGKLIANGKIMAIGSATLNRRFDKNSLWWESLRDGKRVPTCIL